MATWIARKSCLRWARIQMPKMSSAGCPLLFRPDAGGSRVGEALGLPSRGAGRVRTGSGGAEGRGSAQMHPSRRKTQLFKHVQGISTAAEGVAGPGRPGVSGGFLLEDAT